MALRPGRPEGARDRRYVWAVIRGIAPPPDATTRVRVFCNCHDLMPSTRLDHPSYSTSFSFFGDHRGGAADAHASHGNSGASVCVDLTPALARMGNPRTLRSDRVTVQLLPQCASSQAQASAVRARCVEVVVL